MGERVFIDIEKESPAQDYFDVPDFGLRVIRTDKKSIQKDFGDPRIEGAIDAFLEQGKSDFTAEYRVFKIPQANQSDLGEKSFGEKWKQVFDQATLTNNAPGNLMPGQVEAPLIDRILTSIGRPIASPLSTPASALATAGSLGAARAVPGITQLGGKLLSQTTIPSSHAGRVAQNVIPALGAASGGGIGEALSGGDKINVLGSALSYGATNLAFSLIASRLQNSIGSALDRKQQTKMQEEFSKYLTSQPGLETFPQTDPKIQLSSLMKTGQKWLNEANNSAQDVFVEKVKNTFGTPVSEQIKPQFNKLSQLRQEILTASEGSSEFNTALSGYRKTLNELDSFLRSKLPAHLDDTQTAAGMLAQDSQMGPYLRQKLKLAPDSSWQELAFELSKKVGSEKIPRYKYYVRPNDLHLVAGRYYRTQGVYSDFEALGSQEFISGEIKALTATLDTKRLLTTLEKSFDKKTGLLDQKTLQENLSTQPNFGPFQKATEELKAIAFRGKEGFSDDLAQKTKSLAEYEKTLPGSGAIAQTQRAFSFAGKHIGLGSPSAKNYAGNLPGSRIDYASTTGPIAVNALSDIKDFLGLHSSQKK